MYVFFICNAMCRVKSCALCTLRARACVCVCVWVGGGGGGVAVAESANCHEHQRTPNVRAASVLLPAP
jgi:hypothetical protein